MAKYKVGDRVRIVSERPESAAFVDSMVRFLGKEITISKVREEFGTAYYYSEDVPVEDAIGSAFCFFLGVPGWCLWEEWIAGLAEQKKPADENLSVNIHFHGRLTVAELYKNGKVVKVENVRCNSKDEYSRAEGARIAVERLFGKNVASSKNKVRSDDDIASSIAAGVREASKPKVGDKFVIVGKTDFHVFRIGEIVTLVLVDGKASRYKNNKGLRQWVRDCDVMPYKENAK